LAEATVAAARFLVRGKVQGVWFRASTRDVAVQLGLRGYAKNLADGRVEVLAAGEATAIATLETWLRHGPPLARVEVLTCHAASEGEAGSTFRVD